MSNSIQFNINTSSRVKCTNPSDIPIHHIATWYSHTKFGHNLIENVPGVSYINTNALEIVIFADDKEVLKSQINKAHDYLEELQKKGVNIEDVHVSARRKDNVDGYFGMPAPKFVKEYPRIISVKERLAKCHNSASVSIVKLSLEEVSNLTVDDIFAIIFLLSAKKCEIRATFDYNNYIYELDGNNMLEVTPDVINPSNLAILFMIIYYEYNEFNISWVGTLQGETISLKDQDKFMEIAKETGMINYPMVRSIMNAFNIPYIMDSITIPDHLQEYFGSTKQ